MKSLHICTMFFKGGGGAAPALPAPPPPPASATSVEVTQAKIDAARQAKAKKGVNSTLLSSEAGGAAAGSESPDQTKKGNVLLGGG